MQDYEETKKPELFHINFSLFVLFPFNPTPPFKNTEYKTNYRIFAIVKKKVSCQHQQIPEILKVNHNFSRVRYMHR